MKITLNTYQIADELKRDSNARWSYNGSLALAEYLEQYEADSGDEMELDTCAIRCDFSEYDSLHDWARDFFIDWRGDLSLPEGMAGEEEEEDAIRCYIQDHGTLIEFEGGVIVSSF